MKLKLRILLLHKCKEEADKIAAICKENFPQVSVLPFISSSFTGDLIEEHQPEFLFLDERLTKQEIEFEESLRNAIKRNNLKVILLTKDSLINNQSVRYNTIDYLNFPVDKEELFSVFKNLEIESQLEDRKIDFSMNKLKLRTRSETFFVDLHKVIYLKSNGNYIEIYTENTSFTVYASLRDFEDKLSSSFQKVSRSCIVNMAKIKKFVHTEGGYLLLFNDHKVVISRRKKTVFLRRLHHHFLSQN